MLGNKVKKIVVAEDDDAMREIVTHKLINYGLDVKAAKNGVQALELIHSEKPDLVLLDLLMPELDGFGVLEALRKDSDKKIAATKVIVLSNLWSNEDILKAQSFEAKEFLVKAYFTPEEIYKKVLEYIK